MKPLFLPIWLLSLTVFGRLPRIWYSPHPAFALIASPSQALISQVTSSPALFLEGRPRSQGSEQSPGSSVQPGLRFDCLSAADGLSFSMSTAILQDRQGYMWFGTRYGLDKYDGNNFTVYFPAPQSDVMGGNFIHDLYQDRDGDLWMATDIDVVRRNMKTGGFVHYNPDSLAPGRINVIREDATGTIWVGTNGGLSRYNPATDNFTRLGQDEAALSIYIDRQGGAWLGTASGVWYYSSGSFEQPNPVQYQKDPAAPEILGDNVVVAIHEDREGVLWVGTNFGGLGRLDRAAGHFSLYAHVPNDPYSLSENRVYSILEDDQGRLWIGTQDGLNLLDRTTGRFFQYHYNPGDPHGLSNDVVNALYQDRSGVVWIATLAGICKVNETASRFTVYGQGSNQSGQRAEAQPAGDLDPQNPPGLSDNLITSIYQDSHDILWVGTSQGGLNRLDRSAGSITVYRHDPANPTSISWGEVEGIYEDRAGTLWIGTSSGLNRFNPQTGTFESEAALQDLLTAPIVEDQQGNLWVGTWIGLMRRQPGASDFTPVPLVSDPLAPERVQKFHLDRTGALWIATQNDGLFRLDPAREGASTPTVVHFPQDSGDPKSPGSSPVMGFYEAGNGTMWLGTVEDGLVRFDEDTQTFVHFRPAAGVAHYISCIQGDAQGFLWMGTALGLARFDPRSETFTYYDARDGLMIGEGTSCFQGKQGEMFFGSWAGLVSFLPDQIRDNPNAPPVVITALNLRNQALRTDLLPGEQIKLSYQQNYLSFDFAALDYTAPAKNQYAYKMEGLDADWVEAGTRRHADYPDLKPGTYTFRVKASNNSGVWNEQGTTVRITISPPFWQTWWFLGLLGVAVVGAIAGGLRLRLKGVEARSRDLERQVSERTGALEQKTLEIDRRRQELEALLGADDRMQRCLHQDQVLQALVDVAVDILQADKSAVFWWDENRENLSMRVARGFSPQAVSQLQFMRGAGIVAGVAASGEPALVEDALADPRRNLESPQHVQFAIDEGLRSFMFFPITVGAEVLGVFNVGFLKPHAAGQEEQRLFQALIQRAALYIENARLYEQSQELAVLEERSRLARELHDAVTQTLFSASLVAEALPTTWEKDPQEGRGLLQELRSLSRGALAEMRTLLLELRPAALVEANLPDLLHQLGEAASGREGIPVAVQVEGQAELPPDVQIAFYRITQEALNNVIKHARARQVTVRLGYAGRDQPVAAPMAGLAETAEAGPTVQLSVRDDGRGFDPAQIPQSRLGLGIMQERAHAIGAQLTVESQPGHGTQVTVRWKQEGKQVTA